MGASVSKGFSNAWSGLKQGLGAWFDPATRANMLGQIGRKLPTLHQDIARNAEEVSPALGLTAKIASGLIKTIPQAKLAETVLGNIAKGDVGGVLGNAMEARSSSTAGVSGLDLAKGVAKEIRNTTKDANPTMGSNGMGGMPMMSPVKTETKPALTLSDIRPVSQAIKPNDSV